MHLRKKSDEPMIFPLANRGAGVRAWAVDFESVPVGSTICALSANAPVPQLVKLPVPQTRRRRRRGDRLMRSQRIRLFRPGP
jgi:hypothetical protein